MLDRLSYRTVTKHFADVLLLRRVIARLLCQLSFYIFHLLLLF